MGANYTIYNDANPADYYLHRVYRAWNYGVKTSEFENVCLVNSDMMMHPDWLTNLLEVYDPRKNIPVARLVESAKLRSGTHAIEKNFGRHPDELDQEGFLAYAEEIMTKQATQGGLYGCPIFNRDLFVKTGMYPEGNLYRLPNGEIVIGAKGHGKGQVVKSGDAFYFEEMKRRFGIEHLTVFDSIVYHIQEGEMSE